MWALQHVASKVNFYTCMNATDTPPTHGWQTTPYGAIPAPAIKCLTPPTHNPLFLTLALEELVAVDKYHQVTDTIAAISSCGSVPTLLQLIFERLEDHHPPELVGLIMAQVAFSRSGMMEGELCSLAALAGENGIPPGAETGLQWAYFFNAVAPLLRNKGGVFQPLHGEVRDAIFARFVFF